MKNNPPTGPSNPDLPNPSNGDGAAKPNEATAALPAVVIEGSSPPPPEPVAVVTPAEAAALSLSPAQRTAIIRITSGATRSEAAIAAGVTRTTLYRWLNHDPAFQAAFNAWHKDLITTAQGQLLAASQDAINTVVSSIRAGNSLLAWKLLESQGLTKTSKPGSTDVGQLQRDEELDRKRAEIAEKKKINKVLDEDMRTMDPYSSPL